VPRTHVPGTPMLKSARAMHLDNPCCPARVDRLISGALLARGLDVNAKTAKAQAGRGICAVIRFLAGKGADLTAADTTGTRPLTLAAAVDGAADLIKQLIEAPAQQPT